MHGPQGQEKIEQMRRLKTRMGAISRKILVLSGKGGVGKTTTSVNLAASLAARGWRVGLLDTDIHGPNTALMFGCSEARMQPGPEGLIPLEVRPRLWLVSLANVAEASDTAFIWRGPLKIAVLHQLLADVDWPPLDCLVIDSPPGTGDEPLTVGQSLSGNRAALIVTTPQPVSVTDARRTIHFARKLNWPVLGVLENMAGYLTPEGGLLPLFGEGGGEAAAEELQVPFLGRLALDPLAQLDASQGKTFFDSERTRLRSGFEVIVDRILAGFEPPGPGA